MGLFSIEKKILSVIRPTLNDYGLSVLNSTGIIENTDSNFKNVREWFNRFRGLVGLTSSEISVATDYNRQARDILTNVNKLTLCSFLTTDTEKQEIILENLGLKDHPRLEKTVSKAMEELNFVPTPGNDLLVPIGTAKRFETADIPIASEVFSYKLHNNIFDYDNLKKAHSARTHKNYSATQCRVQIVLDNEINTYRQEGPQKVLHYQRDDNKTPIMEIDEKLKSYVTDMYLDIKSEDIIFQIDFEGQPRYFTNAKMPAPTKKTDKGKTNQYNTIIATKELFKLPEDAISLSQLHNKGEDIDISVVEIGGVPSETAHNGYNLCDRIYLASFQGIKLLKDCNNFPSKIILQ